MLSKFEYACPQSLAELFVLQKEKPASRLLAGGTDLIPALLSGKITADRIIDLEGLGLNGITRNENEIKIGAAATFRSILRSDVIKEFLPVLQTAARRIGAIQTQSLATIGGNLCSALPSVDSAIPLLALDARLVLAAQSGERIVKIKDFFTGPGKSALREGELLKEIRVPSVPGRRAAFLKSGRRKGMSLAILNCAVSVELDEDGVIQKARIALGAAAPTPVRAARAEESLLGAKLSPELFARAGEIAASETAPRSSIRASAEYRLLLAQVMVARCLREALKSQ